MPAGHPATTGDAAHLIGDQDGLGAGVGAGGGCGDRRGWAMVAALAITQTGGYGVLYYAFSVFLTPMARDLRAGVAELTGAITVAVLVSGLAAPLVGRRLDRNGGRSLMTAGSLLGAVAVLAWSRVNTLVQLYLVCAITGVAMAMVLYEAAFAVIVAWFDSDRRAKALLAITIVAGFASSVFLPVTGLLVDRYGWRTALVILAIGYGAVAVPLHGLVLRSRTTGTTRSALADGSAAGASPRRPRTGWSAIAGLPRRLGTGRSIIAGPSRRPRTGRSATTGLLRRLGTGRSAIAGPSRRPRTGRAAGPTGRRSVDRALAVALRGRPFWLLAVAFLAQTSAVAVVGVLLVTYLTTLGHSAVFAATVAGLLGVLSVTGRLVTTGLQTRWPVALVTAAVFVLQGLAATLLPLLGRSPVGAIGAVVLFGLGFGVATIARPALLADRYGTASYATISGALALPITVAKAVAPLAAATTAQLVGYPAVMVAVAVACGSGALALAAYHRL